MKRWIVKIIATIISFLIPLFSTLLPLKVSDVFIRKGKLGKTILSCLMCFGGGVFFATYILHMAPEVQNIIYNSLRKPYHIDYPVAELLMALGFFIVLLIESLVINVNNKRQKRKRKKVFKMENQNSLSKNNLKNNIPSNNFDPIYLQSNSKINESEFNKNLLSENTNYSRIDKPIESNCSNSEPDYLTQELIDESVHSHSTRSVILILALSFHRIFEGMSIGLKHTSSGVWSLLLAVMSHEAVIGFSLGLQLVKIQMKTSRIIFVTFLCSFIMPIGVAIGTLITEISFDKENAGSLDLTNGILQAIATGTFIYVTFFEILQDELGHSDSGNCAKLISLLIGFTIMALLDIIPEGTNLVRLLEVNNNSTSICDCNMTLPKIP